MSVALRPILRLLLLALALAGPGFAVSSAEGPLSERERDALAAYRAEDYAAARAHFLALLDGEPRPAGAERGRLLYNLGNVAARQGRWREAVGWYEAARRRAPRDSDTFTNLEFARGQAGFAPADRGDLAATVQRLLGLWTPAERRAWALLGVLLAAAGFAYEALRGGALGRRLALLGAAALALCCAPWLHGRLGELDDPVLVIAEGPVGATSEPRASAARLFEVGPDTRLERLGTFLDWTQVRHPRAGAGWIPSDALFPLER